MPSTTVRVATRQLQTIRRRNDFLNAFVHLKPNRAILEGVKASSCRQDSDKPLSEIDGFTFAIKDNICTKDMPTSCSSQMLADFKPEYDATTIAKLRDCGAVILGKTNMDEFGMGSYSVSSCFGPTKHPLSLESVMYSAGGSSGGSAAAVASGMCSVALGSDTGGSVRLPASYCGLVGFKPSYGLLSRHGLIAYANSLDTIGILARDTKSTRLVFDCIKGYDNIDPTSLDISRLNVEDKVAIPRSSGHLSRTWKIGVPMEYNVIEISSSLKEAWVSTLAFLRDLGHKIVPVTLPSTRHAISSYYIIALAEAASNLAKYDGVRFGLHSASSSFLKGFKETEAMENYFVRAQKVRRLVKQDFNKVFALPDPLQGAPKTEGSSHEGVDVLISPVSISQAPRLEEVMLPDKLEFSGYINDIFTVPASLAGLPAISIPVNNTGKMPLGLQITAQYGNENTLFDVANLIEGLEEMEDTIIPSY
ncbi:hypothetical protein ABW20_dc0103586 [Dactylellina cionopaga]|nr:hypothetical protein ABW20_dc0103586 [Dactylellina cionopaga]